MNKSNIIKTRELDLCISCEICVLACPVNAITTKFLYGQFIPEVNSDKCTMCGYCLEICPGIDIYPLELRERKIYDIICENYLECYTAYSKDIEIRKNSTSGGLITNLVIELIKDKIFDFVFVLDFDKFNGKFARLEATNDINKIFKSSKSKYIPASVYNVIRILKKNDYKNYIIIGTPCQIYGIKKFIKKYRIPEKSLLFLGLFCSHTLNFNVLQFFEDHYAKSNEKISKFQFRTKEKYGWPGHSKISFDSGRDIFVNKTVRMALKKYFKLNRCLFCFDKLNRLADISFGDCYIEFNDDLRGKSNVMIRTKKGKEIFDNYSFLFTLVKENIEKIWKSQKLLEKRDNLFYVKIMVNENKIYPKYDLNYICNRRMEKKLVKSQNYIKWGKNNNFYKIRFRLFLSHLLNKFNKLFLSHLLNKKIVKYLRNI